MHSSPNEEQPDSGISEPSDWSSVQVLSENVFIPNSPVAASHTTIALLLSEFNAHSLKLSEYNISGEKGGYTKTAKAEDTVQGRQEERRRRENKIKLATAKDEREHVGDTVRSPGSAGQQELVSHTEYLVTAFKGENF